MATKPIKSLELHYTMIQFLIIRDILPRGGGGGGVFGVFSSLQVATTEDGCHVVILIGQSLDQSPVIGLREGWPLHYRM